MWNKLTHSAANSESLSAAAPPQSISRPHLNPQHPYSSSPPRSSSSLGRRSSAALTGHPRLTPRSSSLNLNLNHSLNSSTSSLASLQRHPTVPANTESYRELITAPRPHNVPDPLDELGKILGEDVTFDGDDDNSPNGIDISDLLVDEAIDFGGLTLEEFIDDTGAPQDDNSKEAQKSIQESIEDFEKEKDKFLDLHKSIKACDEVLQSVESYLSLFKNDLGQVSAEIQTLQNRSLSLTTRLENRKVVERLLGPVVEDVALSPVTIRRIAEGEVNDTWVKALQDADRKIKQIEPRKAQNIKAVKDIEPELERLTHKALERVRDHFVSKIKSLRSTNANVQAVQQNSFIRYKDLFHFMSQHHPQLADEIAQAYVNTMRWYYHSSFTRYQKALEKLKLYSLDRFDMLGQDESRKNLIPGMKLSMSSAPITYDPFGLGKRLDTWLNRDMPLPNAQSIDEDKGTHWPELPFRCFNVALIDNASTEFSFLTEFFSHRKYDQIAQMFNQIFNPTLSLGQTWTKHLIDNTMDAIAVLLCVRINQLSAYTLQRRRVPVLENYINATNILLWPKFQIVIDGHCDGLKKSTLGSSKQAEMAKQNAAPHTVSQKFGQLLHALLSLSAEAGDDEPVANSLGRVRSEYEAFMTKMSSGISDKKKKEKFLFNNYSLVLTIITDTEGNLATDNKKHLETLISKFRF